MAFSAPRVLRPQASGLLNSGGEAAARPSAAELYDLASAAELERQLSLGLDASTSQLRAQRRGVLGADADARGDGMMRVGSRGAGRTAASVADAAAQGGRAYPAAQGHASPGVGSPLPPLRAAGVRPASFRGHRVAPEPSPSPAAPRTLGAWPEAELDAPSVAAVGTLGDGLALVEVQPLPDHLQRDEPGSAPAAAGPLELPAGSGALPLGSEDASRVPVQATSASQVRLG
jgi:hypothetical protein